MEDNKIPVIFIWNLIPASANTGTILCWKMWSAFPGPLNGLTSARTVMEGGGCKEESTAGKNTNWPSTNVATNNKSTE